METVLTAILDWLTGLWEWMVHLNGALQVVMVLVCVIASGACAVVGKRMNNPLMETGTQGMGRTIMAVVAWIMGTLLMLIAVMGIAAVFAPLVGLA